MQTPEVLTPTSLTFEDWGLIPYAEALERQYDLVNKRIRNLIPDTLVFCSHPPVVTLGRGSDRSRDLVGWSGEVVDVQRGGKATYHGPSQLIGYPIFDLKARGADLHKYLRYLEDVIIVTLKHYGIEADGDRSDATGVWVKSKKIASIGIGVKSWVSFHGFALNLQKDESAFRGINPCGFKASDMISLEELMGHKVSYNEMSQKMRSHF